MPDGDVASCTVLDDVCEAVVSVEVVTSLTSPDNWASRPYRECSI